MLLLGEKKDDGCVGFEAREAIAAVQQQRPPPRRRVCFTNALIALFSNKIFFVWNA